MLQIANHQHVSVVLLRTEDEVIDSVNILVRPRRSWSSAAWLTASRASFLQFLQQAPHTAYLLFLLGELL